MSAPKVKIGTCCSCGYDGEDETPCEEREDTTHCVHWWDGGDWDYEGEDDPGNGDNE